MVSEGSIRKPVWAEPSTSAPSALMPRFAGAGVKESTTVGVLHLKEAVPFNSEVERIVRCFERALTVVRLSAGNADTQSGFNTSRRTVSVSVFSTGCTDLAVEQVFEIRAILFETGWC